MRCTENMGVGRCLFVAVVALSAQCVDGKGAPVTLVSSIPRRYTQLFIGAHPGSEQIFQVFFAHTHVSSTAPSTAFTQSGTKRVTNGTVKDVAYHSNQRANDIRLEFKIDDVATLQLGNGMVSYCYAHHFEYIYLELETRCHLAASHKHRSITALYSDLIFENSSVFVLNGVGYNIEEQRINIEYQSKTKTYTFFFVEEHYDETSSLILVFGLVVFLCAWLMWTEKVNELVEKAFMQRVNSDATISLNGTSYSQFRAILEEALDDGGKRHIVNEYLLKIAADNQVVWNVIDKYAIFVSDIVVLVGSTTFIASMDQRPNLYRQEAIDLTSDVFVETYVVFWGHFFSGFWPFLIVLCLVYGGVTSTTWRKHALSPSSVAFSFGSNRLSHYHFQTRLFIFCVCLLVLEGIVVAIWINFANENNTALVIVGAAPIVLFVAANFEFIQRKLSPMFAMMYRYNTAVLLLVRWAVEVQILAGIHSLLPLTLNQKSLSKYENAVGFFLGVAMSVTTGRDLTWIVHLARHLQANTRIIVLLVLFVILFCVFVMVHTSVFLLPNVYLSTDSMQHHSNLALSCSVSLALQAFSVGSIWASVRTQEYIVSHRKQV